MWCNKEASSATRMGQFEQYYTVPTDLWHWYAVCQYGRAPYSVLIPGTFLLQQKTGTRSGTNVGTWVNSICSLPFNTGQLWFT